MKRLTTRHCPFSVSDRVRVKKGRKFSGAVGAVTSLDDPYSSIRFARRIQVTFDGRGSHWVYVSSLTRERDAVSMLGELERLDNDELWRARGGWFS